MQAIRLLYLCLLWQTTKAHKPKNPEKSPPRAGNSSKTGARLAVQWEHSPQYKTTAITEKYGPKQPTDPPLDAAQENMHNFTQMWHNAGAQALGVTGNNTSMQNGKKHIMSKVRARKDESSSLEMRIERNRGSSSKVHFITHNSRRNQ